jgi:hypothetical protein
LLNAGPAQLDEVDVELADVTAASIGGPHRYQQDTGLAVGAQQRLADAAVLEQAKATTQRPARGAARPRPGYPLRYTPRHGLTSNEAAEQVAVGGLRLQRTAAGTTRRDSEVAPATCFA